jgi:GT2 family glycosyltransferase
VRSLALIFVHYHVPELLARAVRAARADLAASHLDAEIIIVDNGSRDADASLRQSLPAEWIKSPSNLGYAGGINLGVSRTHARCLLLLNADVEVQPGCIASLCHTLERGAAVAGPLFYWDEGCTIMLPPTEQRLRRHALVPVLARMGSSGAAAVRRRWRRHARRHWGAHVPLRSFALSGALLAVRRDAWERVGPFDDGFKLYFEETDWLHRCRRAGLTGYFAPRAAALHRYNQSAMQQPLAGTWFAESADRFERRHYGARFVALKRRLLRACPPVAAVMLPDTSTAPAIDLGAIRLRARGRLWIEVSPTPSGIPAAACVLSDPEPARWQLPEDVWRHLAPGYYVLQAVDGCGRELACYGFRRPSSLPELPPSVAPRSPGVTATA